MAASRFPDSLPLDCTSVLKPSAQLDVDVDKILAICFFKLPETYLSCQAFPKRMA